jgi:hypothetical protein
MFFLCLHIDPLGFIVWTLQSLYPDLSTSTGDKGGNFPCPHILQTKGLWLVASGLDN